MAINSVNISGNLTRDAELRTTSNGFSVLFFSVAVNDRVKNKDTGEWEDRPNYIDVKVFGNRAEAIQQYLGRGSKVAVSGRLRQDKWQDAQTGQNRTSVYVVADEVEFLSRGVSSSTTYGAGEPKQTPYDEDLPF